MAQAPKMMERLDPGQDSELSGFKKRGRKKEGRFSDREIKNEPHTPPPQKSDVFPRGGKATGPLGRLSEGAGHWPRADKGPSSPSNRPAWHHADINAVTSRAHRTRHFPTQFPSVSPTRPPSQLRADFVLLSDGPGHPLLASGLSLLPLS